MNNMQIFAKTLLEKIEVARVTQLSGLTESANVNHSDTAKAISLFQKYTKLDRTGAPDPKTMHMINMVAEGKIDEWNLLSPSSWFNGRDYGDGTSRDDARKQDADKAAQQALAAAAPRGGLDSEGDGKPEWAMNPGGVPAAGSAAPAPPVYTPGPVQQASQGRANNDATGVDAAVTRAEIERAEAAAAAANNPNKPSAPAGKIDWAGSEKGTPLAPGASEKAAAAGQAAAGITPGTGSNKPETTPATTSGPTPAPSISTQPVKVDPKIAAKQKRMRELLGQLKGKKDGGGSGPVDQRPVPSGNNPAPSGNNNIIMNMQRELKNAGADLGTFGPNGDGIDGKMGGKTIAAMKKFPSIAANYGNGKKEPFQQADDGSIDRAEANRFSNRPAPPVPKKSADLFRLATGQSPGDVISQQGVSSKLDPRTNAGKFQNATSGISPADALAGMSPAELLSKYPNPRPPNQQESIGLSEDDKILNRVRNVKF